MANAIMIALGKAKRGSHGDDAEHDDDDRDEHDMSDPMADDDDGSDIDVDEDEMAAGKAAFEAKTPEEYTKALKALIKLCGGY